MFTGQASALRYVVVSRAPAEVERQCAVGYALRPGQRPETPMFGATARAGT